MRFWTGYINMGGVKMESNKIISFSDKSTLIPLFEKYKNKKGTFRFIDDKTLELKINLNEKDSELIYLSFTSKIIDSFSIIRYSFKRKKVIGEFIDDSKSSDIDGCSININNIYLNLNSFRFYSTIDYDGKYKYQILLELFTIDSVESI